MPENKDKKINLNNSNLNSTPNSLNVEEEKDFVYFKFHPFEVYNWIFNLRVHSFFEELKFKYIYYNMLL